MLIEQIVELHYRGPGLTGLTCTSTTGYFHDKTKISKENLTAKMLHETLLLTFPYLDQITYN